MPVIPVKMDRNNQHESAGALSHQPPAWSHDVRRSHDVTEHTASPVSPLPPFRDTTDPATLLARYDAKADAYSDRADALERQQAQLLRNGHRHLAERLNVSTDSLETALAYHQWRADEQGEDPV